MSKPKPPSLDLTVADVKRLLTAVRGHRATRPVDEQPEWTELAVKLQKLIAAPDRPTVFDSNRVLCECGHPLSAHYAGSQKHPCVYGVFDDGQACDCQEFTPKGQRA